MNNSCKKIISILTTIAMLTVSMFIIIPNTKAFAYTIKPNDSIDVNTTINNATAVVNSTGGCAHEMSTYEIRNRTNDYVDHIGSNHVQFYSYQIWTVYVCYYCGYEFYRTLQQSPTYTENTPMSTNKSNFKCAFCGCSCGWNMDYHCNVCGYEDRITMIDPNPNHSINCPSYGS